VFIIHGARGGRGRRALGARPDAAGSGNHDEPAGTDNLSAVDILAAANLVNYYGKLVRARGRGAGPLRPLTPRRA